jgi:hypothetical protein
MTDTVKIALGIALLALSAFGGWMVRGRHEDAVQLQIERIVNAVNEIKGQQIAAIKVENKTINAKTIERIRTDVVYRDCVMDDTMLMLTNKALTGK